MSLPGDEETVIECPSVELDDFQKSDFQLVVNLDCKKLSEIQLVDSQADNHAIPHVCLINSMQILFGLNQKNNQKSRQKAKKRSKLRSTKICKKRPLSTSEMLFLEVIRAFRT